MPAWKIIQPGNERQWSAYFRLRYEVLRKPWGQGAPDQQEPDDETALHGLIMDEKDQALAAARIHKVDDKTLQIRFMAVREDMRGKGLGKAILQFIEKLGKKHFPEANTIMLQARENALPFYLINGYIMVEKSYVLFGSIQHYRMEKSIDSRF
jgi:predicted GNAT family N-acyltransferase